MGLRPSRRTIVDVPDAAVRGSRPVANEPVAVEVKLFSTWRIRKAV